MVHQKLLAWNGSRPPKPHGIFLFGPSYVKRRGCGMMWQVLVQGLQATGMKLPEVAECCRLVAAVALLSDPELGRGPS